MKGVLGIAFYGHHLAYDPRGGWFRWLDYKYQRRIVNTWNYVACRLLGHGDLVQDVENGPMECCMCCRVVKKGTSPIRVWKDRD